MTFTPRSEATQLINIGIIYKTFLRWKLSFIEAQMKVK